MSLATLSSQLVLGSAEIACTHEPDYLALRATAVTAPTPNGLSGAWPASPTVGIFQSAQLVGYAVLANWHPAQTSHSRVDGNGDWVVTAAGFSANIYLPQSLINSTVTLTSGQLTVP